MKNFKYLFAAALLIFMVRAIVAGPGEIWRGAEFGWKNYEGHPFTMRTKHSSVVFDNKMWVIGGWDFSVSECS